MSAAPRLAAVEPEPDPILASVEAFLLRSVRDPSAAVWGEDLLRSAPARAVVLALQERLGDALYALTRHGGGPSAAGALRDAEVAVSLLQDAVRQLGWSHAAFVLALCRERGIRLRVRAGVLNASPAEAVTPEMAGIIREWRGPLAKMLEGP